MNKALTALITAGVFIGGIAATAAPASASTSPTAVCGSGYKVIAHHTLRGSTIYLLYSKSKRRNCVTTIKTKATGHKTRTGAYLKTWTTAKADVDDYRRYAGPVVSAPGSTCLEWGGGTSEYGFWYSGLSNCP